MTTTAAARRHRTGRRRGTPVEHAAARVVGTEWGRVAVRAGIGTRGFLYLTVGYLAMRLALTSVGVAGADTSQEASGTGAVHALADAPGGLLVVALLAVGLAAYAVFSAVDAVLHHDGEQPAKRWGQRALSVAGALLYAGLFVFTLSVLFSAHPGASSAGRAANRQSDVTARALSWPGGPELIGLVGAVLVVVSVVITRRGLAQSFEDRFDRRRLRSRLRPLILTSGTAGLVGRGLSFALVGVEIFWAAVSADPRRGEGLDGSLRLLTHASYGPYLLFPAALGLIVYGGYLGLEAAFRRV